MFPPSFSPCARACKRPSTDSVELDEALRMMRAGFLFAAFVAVFAAAGCATRQSVTLCAHLAGGSGFPADAQDPVHSGDAVLTLEKTAIPFSIAAPGLGTATPPHIPHRP